MGVLMCVCVWTCVLCLFKVVSPCFRVCACLWGECPYYCCCSVFTHGGVCYVCFPAAKTVCCSSKTRGVIRFPMIEQRCVLLDWNVRGLNNSARRKLVRDLAQDTKVSIVCLQETKMQTIDRAVIIESLGQRFAEQFAFLPATGTRGGALLAVDENYYRIVQTEIRVHSVSAQIETTMGVGSWWLTVVYGPQEDHEKLQFLQELMMHY